MGQMSSGKFRYTLKSPICTAGNLEAIAHMLPDKAQVTSVVINSGKNAEGKPETNVTIFYAVGLIGSVSTGDGMMPVMQETMKGVLGTGSLQSSLDADGSIGDEVDKVLDHL